MDLTITHTHADGTLLEGDPRPHHGRLKQLGWHWSRNLGAWYWPSTRDRDAYRPRIDATVDEMQSAGFAVTVTVDDTPRSAADRIEDGMRRAEDRAAALGYKADRLSRESDARYQAYRQVADAIPLGQPMLTDHHSYKADRNRRDKMHRNAERSFDLAREADETRRRSRIAARTAEGKDVGETRRKIAALEADVRAIDRRLADSPYSVHAPQSVQAWRRQLRARREQITDELGYWREHLADLEAGGRKVWGPDDFKAGDVVNRGQVSHEVVRRVNKKSLTVEVRYNDGRPMFYEGHTARRGYDSVTSHHPA